MGLELMVYCCLVWSGLGPGYGIHRIHMFLPIAYVTLWEWVAIRVDKL